MPLQKRMDVEAFVKSGLRFLDHLEVALPFAFSADQDLDERQKVAPSVLGLFDAF